MGRWLAAHHRALPDAGAAGANRDVGVGHERGHLVAVHRKVQPTVGGRKFRELREAGRICADHHIEAHASQRRKDQPNEPRGVPAQVREAQRDQGALHRHMLGAAAERPSPGGGELRPHEGVGGSGQHGGVIRDQTAVGLGLAAIARIGQEVTGVRPVGQIVDHREPAPVDPQPRLERLADAVMINHDHPGLEEVGHMSGVGEEAVEVLGVADGKQGQARPSEASEQGGRGARLHEGAFGPPAGQRPRQRHAAHDVTASHLGARIGEEEDALGALTVHGIALGGIGAT